jgi:hypothetical protein
MPRKSPIASASSVRELPVGGTFGGELSGRWALVPDGPFGSSHFSYVEAAGVELKGRDLAKALMVQDFWYLPVELLAFVAARRLR